MKHFVGFPSKDRLHAETIATASKNASTAEHSYAPWSAEDASGTAVERAVEDWIEDADAAVFDLTYVNENVTYEMGYAIALGKPIRLIRNKSVNIGDLRAIGLFDGLIRDEFKTRPELEVLLAGRGAQSNKWAAARGNTLQPLYVLAPPTPSQFFTNVMSAIKKKTLFKFRSFTPWEITRLSAQEAWEQVSASYGVVVTWQDGTDLEARRNNQRAAFIYGLARGLGIPAMLLAQEKSALPADLADLATRWMNLSEISGLFPSFRDEVQEAINTREVAKELPYLLLDSIRCGDPAAENEQDDLKAYFVETEEFKQSLDGDVQLIVGRKGSGKSAIFLQVRDRIRVDKSNIVVDLNPQGYQLIKLKELLLQLGSLGVRQEFVTAFWQYVLWLEIAYKILEKDGRAASRDGTLQVRYDRLKAQFVARVDTGTGDFSERLRLLTDTIEERFIKGGVAGKSLMSSEVLEIVYGTDIALLRNEILSYLKLKGRILFLFDNLDRMRTPAGFDEVDALLILGLVESMQEIRKTFRRQSFDFQWIVFIRSDVYEFVMRKMSDYGKHTARMLDWRDREVLKRLLKLRIASSVEEDRSWDEVWRTISIPRVRGRETLDFIVDASLMRPRYIIRMFEMAKRRAVNMGHSRVDEEDYEAALTELGWTVIEDLDLELRDIVNDADLLLFDIAQLDGACGVPELRDAVAGRVGATDLVERVIDVLLWSGAIGISPDSKICTFIYDCGYKLQFLRSMIDKNPHAEVCLHPTLANLVKGPAKRTAAAE